MNLKFYAKSTIKLLLAFSVVYGSSTCSFYDELYSTFTGDKQRQDVDLENAIPLLAQQVAHPPGVINNGGSGTTDVVVHDLFSLPPANYISLTSFSGVIDPVGTSLDMDFDGDGIHNTEESTTNIWVADYPVVEASIATPVTMKIEILKDSGTTVSQLSNDITANDVESTKNNGSERVHRDEINEKTVQFQDSYSSNNESSGSSSKSLKQSMSYELSIPYVGGGGGGEVSLSASVSNSWGSKTGYSEAKTNWADRPFKNNLDRNAWNQKSSAASRAAHNYRHEKSEAEKTNMTVESDAGFVRAALYIHNHSVNMPVHLSNILCSLMLETPTGELIPMQSFRLRNKDYSIFEVDIYGDSEFGPYVVELTNLNTAEIENAMLMGYNPKIFVVDYEMTHVADSNYRSKLLHYSGDNLKIIEENAKGRTALLKLIGPGQREMFRLSAFDASVVGEPTLPPGLDICNAKDWETYSASPGVDVAPGITMANALKRLSCSGINVEFENYIIDLSESFPALEESTYFVKGIKSIGGVKTNIPCDIVSDGVTTVCRQKPISQWTQSEIETAGMWAIFAQGKYYIHTEYLTDPGSGNVITFDYTGTATDPTTGDPITISHNVPMVKGVDSTIWAGDHFDFIYISYKDLLSEHERYGTNPLETGEKVILNTRWNRSDLGKYQFDPDVHSTYLGQVGFGEFIQLKFKLLDNKYLNPSFGTAYDLAQQTGMPGVFYTDFNYNFKSEAMYLNLEQAMDIEISLGFGGERTDWMHLVNDIAENSSTMWKDPNVVTDQLMSCGSTLNYVTQEFFLCLRLPTKYHDPVIDPAVSLVNLYMRPAFNNAYREAIWPVHYSDARRYRGGMIENYTAGTNYIKVSGRGSIVDGDTLQIGSESGGYSTTVQVDETNSNPNAGIYALTLNTYLGFDYPEGESVYVDAGYTSHQVRLDVSSDFVSDWNNTTTNTNLRTDPTSAASLTRWRNWYDLMLYDASSGSPSVYKCGASGGYDLFDPIACLGYKPSIVTYNWMGAYNYGIPNWNAWADAGYLSSALSYNKQGTSVGGQYMKIRNFHDAYGNPNNNFPISSDNANNLGQMAARVVAVGDRALVAWSESNGNAPGTRDIKARVFDMSTRKAVGSEFILSTATDHQASLEKVVASGNEVFVIWSSNPSGDAVNYDVKGRVVTLAGAQPWALGTSDFTLNLVTTNQQYNAYATVSGNHALVTWSSNETSPDGNTAEFDIKGRVFDLSSISPDGSPSAGGEFLVNNTTPGAQHTSRTAVNNNRALIVWEDHSNSDLQGRFFDFPAGTPVGDDFQVNTSTFATSNYDPSVEANGDIALVIWTSRFPDTYGDIYGRAFDLGQATPLDNNTTDFQVNVTEQGDDRRPVMVKGADRFLIAWMHLDAGTADIYTRLYSTSLKNLHGSELKASSQTYGTYTPIFNMEPNVTLLNNGEGLLTWPVTSDSFEYLAINYRKINLTDNSISGSGNLVEFDNLYNSFFKAAPMEHETVVNDNNESFTTWYEVDGNYTESGKSENRGHYFDASFNFYNINPDNIIVSPLIERTFELQATVGAP